MTKMLKRDLERKVKELEEKLALVEAERDALTKGGGGSRYCESWGLRCVPVVLTREQVESVREIVYDRALRSFGDGDWLSGSYEEGGIYRDEIWDDGILPGYAGFVVQGPAGTDTDFCVDSVWGLVQIPVPCRGCKKPTLKTYARCQDCLDKWEREAAAFADAPGQEKDRYTATTPIYTGDM
jgi:hypothetical protein